MRSVAVGQLYDPHRRHWAPVPIVRITHAGIHLALMIASPTDAEVEAVRSGVPRFAWIDAENVALLAWSFDPGIPWNDAPYSPHLEQAGDVPGIGTSARHPAVVTVVLVDADTGLVRAVRHTTWPCEFTAVVAESVTRMAAAAPDMNAMDSAMAELYIAYPDTAELVAMKANATCTGGQLIA
ncbi:hypothetical protein [Nocardia sp. alder85J]|uniref:hypothetical protein n=1 Tax=Nocardia sp. alder85J TaxID=2862949 RepID=UPI001CD1CF06|nr:hypothetical protein [Nocardia sp. alder85J]MCX4099136.1 hypothetical protein [Nocardia sp. alder85J]